MGQTAPGQPATGPGGSDYLHAAVRMREYGKGAERYWIFEPIEPVPTAARIVGFMHGAGMILPYVYGGWIRHLVRKGYVVVYPQYQQGQGLSSDQYIPIAAAALVSAIAEIKKENRYTLLDDGLILMGHSLGGPISSGIAVNAAAYGLPPVKALFLAQPAGIFSGGNYADLPPDLKMLVVVGQNDVIVPPATSRPYFDQTPQIPAENKYFITHVPDARGLSIIGAGHTEPLSVFNGFENGEFNLVVSVAAMTAQTNAVDYYCYWKLSEALCECVYKGLKCSYAFGNTPQQRSMGEWSDGEPVNELLVEGPEYTVARASSLNSAVHAYPVPCQDRLWIRFTGANAGVKITDAAGRTVYDRLHVHSPAEADVSHLAPGMYFLHLNGRTYAVLKTR
jgi:acetyl esterase/lipase